MAGKNMGELGELLVIPFALRMCKKEVILANKDVFIKKSEDTFEFRGKLYKISELEEYCSKIITSAKSGTKGGVVKNLTMYIKTLKFLGVEDESLKAPSNELFDIKIDGVDGHIKSYLGKNPGLIGYSIKFLIYYEIIPNKLIKSGQTFNRIIKEGTKVKSGFFKNKKVEKTLKKINKILPQVLIKMDNELAYKTSSEFYNSLTEKEKRALLDFCIAAYSGLAPKTAEYYIPDPKDFIPNKNKHFILQVDKDGTVTYHQVKDAYFEDLFLNDRIYLTAPSKEKAKGCRIIEKNDDKTFYNEVSYFRTKKPKKEKQPTNKKEQTA